MRLFSTNEMIENLGAMAEDDPELALMALRPFILSAQARVERLSLFAEALKKQIAEAEKEA